MRIPFGPFGPSEETASESYDGYSGGDSKQPALLGGVGGCPN